MKHTFPVDSTRLVLFAVVIFVTVFLFSIKGAGAANFCVTNATELQARLVDAENNGQDDTIQVAQGTYNGNFTYSSSEGHSITLLGGYNTGCTTRIINPKNTILDAQNSGRVLDLHNSEGGDIIVDGLTIRNGSGSDGAGIYARSDKSTGDVGDIRFTKNIITGNTTGGEGYNGGGVNIYSKADSGTSANVIISDNTITGNMANLCGGGVFAQIDSVSGGNSGEITVTNNIIAGNTAMSANGGGMYIESDVDMDAYICGDVFICNNTVTGNQASIGGGIDLNMNNGTAKFYNNIIWGNSASWQGDDLNLGSYLGTADFYGYHNDYSELYSSCWDYSGNNIDQDPLFMNPATGNYHLKGNSPCINAGIYGRKTYIPATMTWVVYNYSFIPDEDFEGDTRDSDWIEVTTNHYYKYCDIGADEYTSTFLPCVPLLLLSD